MRTFVYEIKIEDIGKKSLKYIACSACQKTATIQISDLCGVLMAIDIGKRIYQVNGIYQIENDEQLANRQ